MSELIARAQAGDQPSMEQLIIAYQRRVAAIVISIIGNDDDWEDLCQQIFVKMVLKLHRLKNREMFESWLFRIARNTSLDHLRRRRALAFLVPWQKSHDSIAGEPQTEPDLKSAALNAVIPRLPPAERELVVLLRERYWTYSGLTEVTGHSVSAIKSRLFRARRRLRQLMSSG